jgi:hypothetical protein
VEYVGIDWSYRRAAWCALSDAGRDARAVVEMMSGAIWVRDTLAAAGWEVQIAHARKVLVRSLGRG